MNFSRYENIFKQLQKLKHKHEYEKKYNLIINKFVLNKVYEHN